MSSRMAIRTKLYCRGPGGVGTHDGAGREARGALEARAAPPAPGASSEAESGLWLKARDGGQRDGGGDAGRVALQLVDEDRHELGIELPAAQPGQLVGRCAVRPGR